jgi:hypothetical protein
MDITQKVTIPTEKLTCQSTSICPSTLRLRWKTLFREPQQYTTNAMWSIQGFALSVKSAICIQQALILVDRFFHLHDQD